MSNHEEISKKIIDAVSPLADETKTKVIVIVAETSGTGKIAYRFYNMGLGEALDRMNDVTSGMKRSLVISEVPK